MKKDPEVHRIAFVGNYLPRKCGIATFTSDLLAAVAGAHPDNQCFAVAVNDGKDTYEYPEEVRFEIEEQDLLSYVRAADFLNMNNVDIVCLQHEFGIYGGPAGAHVLAMLRELRMPVVTTLHTVLRNPDPDQLYVMEELVKLSTRLVVMSKAAQQMLERIYKVPSTQIDLIPHGIPDVAFVDPAYFKGQFDAEGRTVMLTFGLLSPGKGVEHVLNALPRIVQEFPEVIYMVLGATHPNEVRHSGESYRNKLEGIVKAHGLENNVRFYNQFVDIDSLKEYIGAADIYVTPYLNEAQITSGTLAYTFGAGKAVISTPYWHAQELLADGRGILVPFADSDAIAQEVISLLREPNRHNQMRTAAYRLGREMIWSNVGQLYMSRFEASRVTNMDMPGKLLAMKALGQKSRPLPTLRLDHVARMTDSTGIFQHAIFSIPNFSEGYCTDDNARAFILTVLLSELGETDERVRHLASTYAAFLHHAFDYKAGRFHNHMSFDRRWLDDPGSEDCHGRAIWALGTAVGRSPYRGFPIMAGKLLTQALPALTSFTSPRAWAFGLLGIHEYLGRFGGDSLVNQTRDQLTNRLVELFERNSFPNWCWFESELSYDNAKLAHAVMLSGLDAGQDRVFDIGLRALRWLTELQICDKGHFRPIGCNGFYRRDGARADFDQQPVEAQSMVAACLEAYRATSDYWWYDQAQRVFSWFGGNNDLGVKLYSAETGACRDGLHVDRVNANQGAESTLAFLISLAEMRLYQNRITSFKKPTYEQFHSDNTQFADSEAQPLPSPVAAVHSWAG